MRGPNPAPDCEGPSYEKQSDHAFVCFLARHWREHKSQAVITLILRTSSSKHCCHFEAQVYLGFSLLYISNSHPKLFHSMDFFSTVMCVPRLVGCTGHPSAWQITILWELFIFHTFLLEMPFFSSSAGERKGQWKSETSPFFPLATSQKTCILWQDVTEKPRKTSPVSLPQLCNRDRKAPAYKDTAAALPRRHFWSPARGKAGEGRATWRRAARGGGACLPPPPLLSAARLQNLPEGGVGLRGVVGSWWVGPGSGAGQGLASVGGVRLGCLAGRAGRSRRLGRAPGCPRRHLVWVLGC